MGSDSEDSEGFCLSYKRLEDPGLGTSHLEDPDMHGTVFEERKSLFEDESEDPPWLRNSHTADSSQSRLEVQLFDETPMPEEDSQEDEGDLSEQEEQEADPQPSTPAARKRRRAFQAPNSYCQKKKPGSLRLMVPDATPPRPPKQLKRAVLSEEERKNIIDHCVSLSPHDRQLLFKSKRTQFGVAGSSCRNIFTSRSRPRKGRGTPQKLTDEKLQALYDEVVQARANGTCYTSDTLRERVIAECDAQSQATGLSPPCDRSIDNYVARIKQMGLRTVVKPQIQDERRWKARESFRNGLSTFAVAGVTHHNVHSELIINIDPTTIFYGRYRDSMKTAIIPDDGSTDPVRVVGKISNALQHQIKLITIANHSGDIGDMVFVSKQSSPKFRLAHKNSIVKIPLPRCHPTGSTGFGSSLWLVPPTVSPSDIMKEFLVDHLPPFIDFMRNYISRWTELNPRCVLWVDCGQDMTSWLTSPPGREWCRNLNMDVNLHAAKFTGVAQQLDVGPCFRCKISVRVKLTPVIDLCVCVCVCVCILFIECVCVCVCFIH